MRQRENNYHIQIKPELLFDVYGKFRKAYTPWIYAYLKLDYNNFIFKAPNKFYEINRKQIGEFFNIDLSTVSRSFIELINNGLMVEYEKTYRLLNDLENTGFPNKEGFPEFIQIYNNFFIDFGTRLKNICREKNKKARTQVKAMELFFYLITKNHHAMVDSQVLYSNESIKSLSKSLRHDEKYIKEYLNILENIEQIEIDEDGIISTTYVHGTCQPFEKKQNISSFNNSSLDSYKFGMNSIKEIKQKVAMLPENQEISELERIGYILNLHKGNDEKIQEMLKIFKISNSAYREYLQIYNQQ